MKCQTLLLVLHLHVLSPLAEAFNVFGPPPSWQASPQPSSRSTETKRSTTTVTKRIPSPPPPPPNPGMPFSLPEPPSIPDDVNPLTPNAWNSLTSTALGWASKMAPKSLRKDSPRAAHVRVNRLPPDSFQIDLSDVPIVGHALSGTYAKIQKPLSRQPSVVISSPTDKWGALQEVNDKGTLEFGLQGMFQSTLDVQLEPNRPGVAPIEIKSPLIPKWPFGRKKSDWNKVQNLGNGDTYYFNSQTGETRLEEP